MEKIFNRKKELQKQREQYKKCYRDFTIKIKENPDYKIVYRNNIPF